MKNLRHAIRLGLVALILLTFTGCAWWQKSGKQWVSTVDDIARSMCSIFYGERMGISPDEAARIYCKTREAWAPWIDPALASMEAGGTAKLNQTQPTPQPTTSVLPSLPADGNPPYLPSPAPSGSGGATPQAPAETAPDAGSDQPIY